MPQSKPQRPVPTSRISKKRIDVLAIVSFVLATIGLAASPIVGGASLLCPAFIIPAFIVAFIGRRKAIKGGYSPTLSNVALAYSSFAFLASMQINSHFTDLQKVKT